jgi:hypothetical protein
MEPYPRTRGNGVDRIQDIVVHPRLAQVRQLSDPKRRVSLETHLPSSVFLHYILDCFRAGR